MGRILIRKNRIRNIVDDINRYGHTNHETMPASNLVPKIRYGGTVSRNQKLENKCWGFVTLWCGSGSGSPDPYL
jgi:hypothetical protein